ncbi:Sau3AI family type II restriction endonuclease [Clostridium sp.]|uniref:Sau3AI family type II restriction endonuclease n=1 Tax=Clostridium sp. TaxID=1506 RepID=UPI0039925032
MKLGYDDSNKQSIENYAIELVGKSLIDVLNNDFKDRFGENKSKGKLGNIVEESYFGYKINSKQEADFKKVGVELKVAPLKALKPKKNPKNLREKACIAAKERIVLTIIDYLKVGLEDWENNTMMDKCRELLLMFYMYEKDKPVEELVFRLISLWSPSEEDLKVIKNDWLIINKKIKNGQAHEISEGDTMYLGACTKGSTAEKSKRQQPFSDILAPQRAFCFKNSYVNSIIEELLEAETYSRKKKVKSLDGKNDGDTFDNFVLNKFKKLEGLSITEIMTRLEITRERKAKSFVRLVTEDISKKFFGDKVDNLEEFKKANIEMKVIVTQPSLMPKESMSFEQINYLDIEREEWEYSEIKSKFENNKFLWVIYKSKKNYEKQSDISLDDLVFYKAMFWNMPIEDINGNMKFVWEDTVDKIRSGIYNNFIGISDKKDFHVRFKGANKEDKALTIQGTYETKRCFWLNADYVKKQILKVEED